MTSATISNWQMTVLNVGVSPNAQQSIEEIFNCSGFGKSNSLEDVTNWDSPAGTMEYIAGLSDGAEFTVEANFVPNATGQEAVMAAVDAQASRAAVLTYTGTSPNKTYSMTVVCLDWELGPGTTTKNTITFKFKISGDITRA